MSASRIALITGAGSGIGLALVRRLLDDPDTALVYAGSRHPERCQALDELATTDDRLRLVRLDVTQSDTIQQAASLIQDAGRLDLVINTAGILHSLDGMRPEKRLADINPDDLLHAYNVNALGSMRLAAALEALLSKGKSPRFVSLSARVGSIGDNRLGGWYGYRASKAALNMLLRTLSIEWGRRKPAIICAALHPGTVATALSEPFTRDYRGKVFSPDQAAGFLLDVITGLEPEQSGGFYAWDGAAIPW